MRVEHSSRPLRPDFILLMIALIATGSAVERAVAETRAAPKPHTTTLIVFAKHEMPEGEWAALLGSIRRDTAEMAKETPAVRGPVEVLRGDAVEKGLHVDEPIPVYLHGDCRLFPRPRYIQAGRLGWVMRVHGHIEPFIHVDCTQLVDMLGPIALEMTMNRRNTVMGEAITRVVLHEWIHIATQNPKHAEEGVEKPAFSVTDLLADEAAVGKKGRKS
jgi:hypothetical protein